MPWAAVSPISQYIVRRVRPSRWLPHWLLVRCAHTPTCTRCQVSVVHEAPISWASSYPSYRPRQSWPPSGGGGGENAETIDLISADICTPIGSPKKKKKKKKKMVPNFESFSVDNHRITAGQSALFLVGLTGFKPQPVALRPVLDLDKPDRWPKRVCSSHPAASTRRCSTRSCP